MDLYGTRVKSKMRLRRNVIPAHSLGNHGQSHDSCELLVRDVERHVERVSRP
jgi:hypothetical protein